MRPNVELSTVPTIALSTDSSPTGHAALRMGRRARGRAPETMPASGYAQFATPSRRILAGTGAMAIPRHRVRAHWPVAGFPKAYENANRFPSGDHTA